VITEWLLDMFESVILWMIGLLPFSDVNAWDGILTVVDGAAALNYWLPISELLTFVTGVLSVLPAFLVVTLAVWVWKMIRG
jgi:hypothetical protein